MIKQEFRGASGILLPGAITIPKGEEIAISQDWLIFPDAITGEGKVWTIDGLLEPCIKPDNEVWVDSNVENPFAEPIIYKGKNKYGWLVGEVTADTINELDFIDRKSVRNIILSNYVTEIPGQAFFDCYDLQNIIISNSVKRIGNVAFCNCGSIKNLTIPDTVVEMGGGVFKNCTQIESIKLPNILAQLDSYEYIYENGCFEMVGFFENCNNLLTIVLPLTLQNIDNYAFNNCYSLISIEIPDSVTSIGDYAFYQCDCRRNLILGNSVNYIGNYAFAYNNLFRIVSYAETPPTIDWGTFKDVNKSIPLEVPNADLYREAPYWQEFYNIYNINPYQLNVSSNNEEWGTVSILEHNTSRSIVKAIVKNGSAFKQWSDGDTSSWKELNITEDTTLVALFGEPYQCEIVNLEIIDYTPTSVTVRFEITCNEERDTLERVLVLINNGEFNGSVENKPGILETIIEGLQPETVYQIRVAVMNDAWYWEERDLEFTTLLDPHPYVDLGLPSGILWADRNVGAETQQDNGLYFSWGNVDGHAVDENGNITDGYSFDENTYPTTLGGQYTGSTLDAAHDAATVNMSSDWRMPTREEMLELVENTDHYYIGEDGNIVAGPFNYETNSSDKGLNSSIRLRSICFVKKGEYFDYDNRSNFIEFPFAGYCFGSLLSFGGSNGYVLSCYTLDANSACCLSFNSRGFLGVSGYYSYFGKPVRGVKNN